MLFPALLPLAAVAWMAAAAPATSVVAAANQTVAATERQAESAMVEVVLYDENHPETHTIRIGHDGTVDDATRQLLERLFRCKRTERHHSIDQGLLAKLADVAAHYPGHTIEFVSAFRATDRHSSRHYQGRALDFRIRDVSMIDVRDYIWSNHHELGLGWYPGQVFVHMDHRVDDADIAWTELHGVNHYHPSWSTRVRRGEKLNPHELRVGL